MIGRGIEGRLLNRGERAVAVGARWIAGVEHLPLRLAASEILVPAGAGETVEALDSGGESHRVEIDHPGEFGDAAGLAEPVGIAPAQPHRHLVLGRVAGIEDPPAWQMEGPA